MTLFSLLSPTVTRCPPNFEDVDGTCLYLDKVRQSSWVAARHVCFNLGGDLAVFPDANAFASALRYINSVGKCPYTIIISLFLFQNGLRC